MERDIDRRVPATPASQLVELVIHILALPRRIDLADAVVVLPGQGEDSRLKTAVKAYNKHANLRHLIVAASYPGERTWFLPTVKVLQRRYGLKRTEGVIVHESAPNTLSQAQQVLQEVRRQNVASYALVAPPYHLVRAYLTHINAMNNVWVPMIPLPACLTPFQTSPETRLTCSEMVPGEVARIPHYQEVGDVATYETALEYIEWLWREFMPRDSFECGV